MKLTLAYSPCPNDTFLFYYLVHSNLSSNFSVKEELHDVEHLNAKAQINFYNITKLSFFAYFHVMQHYVILNSGSALGRGCGPILVKKKSKKVQKAKGNKILVPGLLTTANLLLNLFLDRDFEPVPIRYDQIIPKLLNEEFEYGVLIHEERFTFEQKGLELVEDLGEFWEACTQLPIPLGCIGIQRNLPNFLQEDFDFALRKSLELAYQNPEVPMSYILQHSQVKDISIVKSHIALYVNEFTKDLGEEGKSAILKLYEEARRLNLLSRSNGNAIELALFRT